MLIIICLVLISEQLIVDCRVFCQDENAEQWSSAGYSCPVKCQNIVQSIDMLKRQDYKNIFGIDDNKFNKLNEKWKTENIDSATRLEIKDLKAKVYEKKKKLKKMHMKGLLKKITHDKNYAESLRETETFKLLHDKMADEFQNGTFPSLLEQILKDEELMFKYRRLIKSFRRSRRYEDDFLKIITKILNDYAVSKYKFTEEITLMLLKHILGDDLDLHQGVFDVQKVLSYLDRVLRQHTQSKLSVVRLKSVHCLSVYVPGCYCKDGYVESSGRCVAPSECVGGEADEYTNRYLKRILI